MPFALGSLALAIFQAGGPIWLSNALVGVGALGGVFSAVGQIALSFGIAAVSSLVFRAKPARPEDVQQSLRVAISDRIRVYGQGQVSGNWFFGASKDGQLHKGLVCCEGLLVEALAFKIDQNTVVPDFTNGGQVNSSPYDGQVKFQYRRGLPTETYYSELAATFPEYTSAHRGDGCVTIYAKQLAVKAEKVTQVFPSLKDTLYRIEGKFTEVWNPVTGVTAWSDNAAAIIRDFMGAPSGMRIPNDVLSTPLAIAAWRTAFNRAAEAVPLKAGGTEPRYRLWGAYKFSQLPGSVLETMMLNSDARPILTRDGGVAIEIRTTPAPIVLLDKKLITACVSLTQGMDVRTTANKITAKFLSAADDYQLVDADPWLNVASISNRGEISDDIEYSWSPSHGQTRRLMKMRAYRLDPKWIMTVNCRLGAIAAFQEPFVTVDYTIGPMRIFGIFEVDTFSWNIGDKGVLQSFTIALRSIDAAAYSWNPLTDEGTAPVTPDIEIDRDVPAVSNFVITVARRKISDAEVAYAVVNFTRINDSLKIQVRGKKTSEATWTTATVPDDADTHDFLLMDNGVQYEYQARHITATGRAGEWGPVPSLKITAIADTVAPSVPTNVVFTGGAGKVTAAWKTPNSANFRCVIIRRNIVNNIDTATVLPLVYGSPNTSYTGDDTALAAGTYYYWISAANASGVESSPVASGAKTVT